MGTVFGMSQVGFGFVWFLFHKNKWFVETRKQKELETDSKTELTNHTVGQTWKVFVKHNEGNAKIGGVF